MTYGKARSWAGVVAYQIVDGSTLIFWDFPAQISISLCGDAVACILTLAAFYVRQGLRSSNAVPQVLSFRAPCLCLSVLVFHVRPFHFVPFELFLLFLCCRECNLRLLQSMAIAFKPFVSLESLILCNIHPSIQNEAINKIFNITRRCCKYTRSCGYRTGE